MYQISLDKLATTYWAFCKKYGTLEVNVMAYFLITHDFRAILILLIRLIHLFAVATYEQLLIK